VIVESQKQQQSEFTMFFSSMGGLSSGLNGLSQLSAQPLAALSYGQLTNDSNIRL
jgi:hypothetical protein